MNTVFETMKEKMNKTIMALEKEFAGMRAGRATPAILDKISVDYYGVPTPIQQMAAVSVSEGRVLVIQPWDVSKTAEDSKVAIRSIRRDGIDKIKAMKKNSEITEDDQKKAETKIQKITDDFIKEIDVIADKKEKEIMEI